MNAPDRSAQLADLTSLVHAERSPAVTSASIVALALSLVATCTSAGLTLAAADGLPLAGSSSDGLSARADAQERDLDDGPARDRARTEETILVADMADEPRWPRWAPYVAAELGMRSMLRVPLLDQRGVVGTLTFFAPDPRAFDDQDVETAHALATHATIAILAARGHARLESQVSHATALGQATGVLMNGYGMTSTAALDHLVDAATRSGRDVSEVAADLVADHDGGVRQRPLPSRRAPRRLLKPSADGDAAPGLPRQRLASDEETP